ncbi:hypothetical protein CHLNCDRAFT_18410 [Chlorella variabilis]|uniref:Steroid 5-alpha-reductase DET2 n=1 Tax=Chlorella variabilis TaxID=554065 RepID=E1Z2I1_CHLVA|nr:hypothetical protein CHLNCDRAFT_18410 [Chlorella variabilis]EFN60003.1 hypothetical protein CHLNCDRAFT_18410 [Chlorella variabilis]|eukprot:XP_005852105.1 hypothetical protein CHLNCDRAFT_18410 [Chlorella variabilis]
MALQALAEAVWAIPTSQLAWGMIAAAVVTFFMLLFGPVAPYSRAGWGFLISPKLAWVTQEMWSFLVPAAWLAFYATPEQWERVGEPANGLLMAMFLLHYFHRDFIFPLRLRGSKPTPFVVWLMASVFCVYNGYMQARRAGRRGAPTKAPITDRTLTGAVIWLMGWLINLEADNILINLRKPGETGYKIPRGGMFERVSAANYFGEIVEWCGFALAAYPSLPAAAFALFSFANLAPRGWRHHLWYKAKFGARYPPERNAIIPYIW